MDHSSGLPTHATLVEKARRWLVSSGCPVVVTELSTSGEEPDAIGWRGGWSIIVECKASREDFRRDHQKFFRHYVGAGMGHQRYLLVPAGLIEESEIPDGWGLLVLTGGSIREATPAPPHEEYNWQQELRIMTSTLRRVGQTCPGGVHIRCYAIPAPRRPAPTPRASLSVAPVG